MISKFRRVTPARRKTSASVAFLASDGARYINGEVINVGGGMVL